MIVNPFNSQQGNVETG